MMRAANQARAFAMRHASTHAATGFASVDAARAPRAGRTASANGLALARARIATASGLEPLALTLLVPPRPAAPVQHVRHISQHVQHLHLQQQFIHRLTLNIEQTGALPRPARRMLASRQPGSREHSVERVLREQPRLVTSAATLAQPGPRERRANAALRLLLRETLSSTTRTLQSASPIRIGHRPRMMLSQPREIAIDETAAETPEVAPRSLLTIVARRNGLVARRLHVLERATRHLVSRRSVERLLLARGPAAAASRETREPIVMRFATSSTSRIERYGANAPIAATLATRQQSAPRAAEIRREIERIERTVQTKVVREILHQGHQQQHIRTALSDALVSPKLVQALARKIQASLEQRANVERYRKGAR